MKFGVIVFPGSNCDSDAYYAVRDVLQQPVEYIWHQSTDLKGIDCVLLPGGFSYGDYLRTGAIARFSPVMGAVEEHVNRGGLALGICNGFQILCEAHLLPGALMANIGQKFICRHVNLRVEHTNSVFTNSCEQGQVLRIPIAHGDGNYYCDPETLAKLEDNGRVLFRYCDPEGNITQEANPNGSLASIAGIMNERGNVAGMMPHPERAAESMLGSDDGRYVLQSLVSALVNA